VALDSATNAAINSIAASGKSSASSGAAVSTDKETMVPLAAVASYAPGNAPISVNHQSGELASTISFNLPANVALGTAAADIQKTMSDLDVPLSIQGSFAGTAAAFQSSLGTEPLLIMAALAAVYIVLGILYESTIHPITIISTIPSAGIGALLLLMLLNTPLTIIALIGVILLIGIVKKNAILMIDFALQLERGESLAPEEAIFKAAVLRFRPIMMTSFAAILGALPLAIGLGQGASLRQPLGITIIGGLLVSQALTLYTTPVVYLFLDKLALRMRGQDSAPPRTGSIVEAR
jgi:multidrug efflux pump